MMKREKGWFTDSRMVALTVFVCAALCLLIGLMKAPRLYTIDFGQYEAMLRQCSLTWTQEDIARGDLQYVRPLTTFDYTRFSWASLFSPQAESSTVYAVAAVRLFTAPFGLPFSVDALSYVWAFLLALATGLISGAMYRKMPRAWLVPALMLCALFTDGNFCAIFRSLYPEAAAIAFSLLYLGSALWAWSLDAEARKKRLLPVLALSVLALKSLSPLMVFLPLILVVDGCLVFSCWKQMGRRWMAAVVSAVVLFCGVESAVRLLRNDADYFSNATLYESAFNTLLSKADAPEEILKEWELDDSYLDDIGKSYYEAEDQYAHNPRNAEEAEILFSRITAGTLLKTYLRHPGLLVKALNADQLSFGRGFENARNITLSPNQSQYFASRADGGILSLLWKLLPGNWPLFAAVHAALLLGWAAAAIYKRRKLFALFALFSLCSALFLPFAVILDGYAQSQQYMLYQIFLAAALLAELTSLAVYGIPPLAQWLTAYSEHPYILETPVLADGEKRMPPARLARPKVRALERLSAIRFLPVLLAGVLCAGILAAVYLPAAHPVSVNNGDFGRMMEQLDVTWESMEYFNTASQAGHHGIENYAYSRNFDWQKLTPLKPTYSLYWFAAITRLLTQPFGLGFSTYLLSWVMGIIMLLCVLRLVKDVSFILGKWTIPAALLLCALLFNETYLTWLNSLYGEGCILTGLMMTLACAVHLCVMPRKRSAAKVLWLLGLALSLNILVTAKSQMLMAAPGAILLFLVLCWYQRPYRYDLQAVQGLVAVALCGAIALSAVGVYRSDRTEDSVSQRHTMWQAYFYGIFMISDDPIADMEALGVDTAMAPDIGKFVSFDADEDYVYAPLSPEAKEAFYDHVSMFTIIQWYLTHPTKLWQMLDHAARESKSLYTGFRVYNGQDYADQNHDPVNGWNLWPAWRSSLTPGHFLGYVVFYAALLFVLIRYLLLKEKTPEQRIVCCIPMFLMITGVLQFPLSVLGNGFADNQKQLFCFSLCHDLLLACSIVLIARYLCQLPKDWRFPLFKGLSKLKGSA